MPSFDEKSLIWYNGEFKPWAQATIHIMSHVVHYGSSVFEGIRCYSHPNAPAIFRLHDHAVRLVRSAKVYRMEIPYSIEAIEQACHDVISRNKYRDGYLRPIAYRGYGSLGVDPSGCPVHLAIGVMPWGAYLGDDALKHGVDVCVSSWQKIRPNTIPAMAKAGGQYLISQLAKMEAKQRGYHEGLLLDANGYVSEGSGENIFVVYDGKVYTPPIHASILPGITRDCALKILAELGVTVDVTDLPREMLYLADEIFFTGTAAEITPIRSIDGIAVGSGMPGEITKAVQKYYFDVIRGESEDKFHWLSFVK